MQSKAESNILHRKLNERPKYTPDKPDLGEEVDTDESVVVYPKEHLKEIYVEGVKEAHKKKKIIGVGRGIKRLKPIDLIDGVPAHSVKGRKYFKDAVIVTLAVTSARNELNFFNHYEQDKKFQGYCYSPKLNKLLRVYDGKCYKATADEEKMGEGVDVRK